MNSINTDLAFDPDDVDIGDGMKTTDSVHASWVSVTDVAPETEQVKVYSPTGRQTTWRWVSMDSFAVHSPNDDIQTDEDRVEWLNTLPKTLHVPEDGEVQTLEYVIVAQGECELKPVE